MIMFKSQLIPQYNKKLMIYPYFLFGKQCPYIY